jgi:hypothetical protein
MKYAYRAFGVPVYSDIELPALLPYAGKECGIRVYIKTVSGELREDATVIKPFTKFNTKEWVYQLPDIGRYYVHGGNEIWIDPLTEDMKSVLLYFYSNCLAAVLLQRNLLVYHVSGVLDASGKVVLIAGASGAGKSTTATFLKSKGYSLFTDDTALLSVREGKCYARASYPMTRLWEQTVAVQKVYADDEKQVLRTAVEQNKYGFYFHDDFLEEEVEVSRILFLQEEGTEMKMEEMSLKDAMSLLFANLYRAQWHKGMNKQVLVFQQLSQVVKAVPMHKVSRPKGVKCYQEFAEFIESNLL